MNTGGTKGNVPGDRRVTTLAAERATLFARAGGNVGRLPKKDQERLRSVERELDECFTKLRQQRAIRDAERFARENPTPRRTIPRPLHPRTIA
jgi:hypothetical protein